MTINNPNLDPNLDPNKDNLNPPKTFTQEDVDKLLQAESDKRVSQALLTAKTKWEEEYKQKLEIEKSEAEKLAQLSEQEKAKMEIQKQKDEFENERKQFLKEKLELQTVKELANLGLPTEFSRFVVNDSSNAEDIKKSIDILKTEWEKAIEVAVDKKLQGSTPRTSTRKDGVVITKEQFRKMGYAERMAIFEQDEEMYKQLSS